MRGGPHQSGPAGIFPAGPVVVGAQGHPWMRDLDFGTQFLGRVAEREWPSGVVLEDLSYSAHRVLHTLQALAPSRMILIGAVERKSDPAGTIRRYPLDLDPPDDDEVAQRLGEAVGGIIDLDHTLAVVRYWKGFPSDTTVIEVEPGDVTFGLGFSDPVEAAVEEVYAMVMEEVRRPMSDGADAGSVAAGALGAQAGAPRPASRNVVGAATTAWEAAVSPQASLVPEAGSVAVAGETGGAGEVAGT